VAGSVRAIPECLIIEQLIIKRCANPVTLLIYFTLLCSYALFISQISPRINSPDLISADLILSELTGCEATQFAVAATNCSVLVLVKWGQLR